MNPVESTLSPEDRARLARKGEILYGKSCGTKGRGICAESFALHQARLGNVEVVRDLLRFLDSQSDALRIDDRDGLLAMTEALPRESGGTWRMRRPRMGDETTIWTIGHSTRGEAEFLELLAINEIAILADVRRFAGSRKYPHFNADAMTRSLGENGIEYVPLPELGGRRRPGPDSPNTAWRSESFRGYADYMETDEYRVGIARLLDLTRRGRTAFMCSEAPWWRCHRALIADELKSRGATVIHIMSLKKNEVHPYTSAARIVEGRLSYEAG